MIPLASFGDGFGLSAALIVAIGAQNTFVLRQGLLGEHVGAVVALCALADGVLIAAGVAGVGAVLRAAPNLVLILTLGGAGFLAAYGVAALRRAARPGRLAAGEGAGHASLRATLWRAAGFTLLNPHVYLDTVLLVGTVGQAQPPGGRLAFVAGAAIASLAWFTLIGFGARLLAPVFARPAAWRVLDGLVAAVMLTLAAGLLARALALPA